MVCPHCQRAFHDSWIEHASHRSNASGEPRLVLEQAVCPACNRMIVRLRAWRLQTGGGEINFATFVIYPGRVVREPPPEVTGEYAQDFREACLVLPDSTKASAALSRRLLQHIIHEKAGITGHNLNEEIDELIAQGVLPSDLAHDLDALRQVGNFAAHPIKSTNTGAVVDVEAGEAEWLIELVDELLDFYFVRPAKRAAKRDALNAKLGDAGKPPLKGTDPPAVPEAPE